jgi:putative sterol carrier protein
MTNQFLDSVKDQLATRSTRTTLAALQERGMQKVRVIRSSQILQLIEEAVDRALHEQGLLAGEEQRNQVLQASQEIFQGMMQGQMAPTQAMAPGQDMAPGQEMVPGQMMMPGEAQQQAGDAELLEEYRARQELLEAENQQLRGEVSNRDLLVQEEQARSAELNAELQVLHTRQQSANPDSLLEELRLLRGEIGRGQGDDQGAQAAGVLEEQIANLGQQLGQEIDRISRKVGVAAKETAPADLSALFNRDDPELESNLENVQTEEHKGSDVADALAVMRSLKGKK